MSRFIPNFLIVLMLFLLSGTLYAQEEVPAPEDEKVREAAYPGVDEVAPRSSQLLAESAQANRRITELRQAGASVERFDSIRQRLHSLEIRMGELAGPLGHDFDQVLDLREKLTEERETLEFLLEDLSSRIAEIASIASTWKKKEQFWPQWLDLLENMDFVLPRQEFEQARENIHNVLEQVSSASASLVQQQKEVADQQVYVNNLLVQVEAIVRGQTFKRISHSFASREYIQQFDAGLWERVREGIRSVEWVGPGILRSQEWLVALQGSVLGDPAPSPPPASAKRDLSVYRPTFSGGKSGDPLPAERSPSAKCAGGVRLYAVKPRPG